jgi:hypothetical protein
MAQKRNLNVNPYYDDFNNEKNFYKVLFKPGFPVQARELTTLQSILQNQVESFGKNIFKEGSMVIPGGITYDPSFYAVKLNSINSGVEVSTYIKNFIGTKITGQVSGVTATVQYVATPGDPNIDDLTIYVKYDSSGSDFVFTPFENGESLSANKNITYGNTTINSGTPFASLLSSNATATGSAVSISDGVYFIRGYFVNVSSETILLDEYSNTPSYRVGLKVDELLIDAKEDNSLYDNAKGFSNYAAPGADRLKIGLSLSKKSLDDLDDKDFVELLRVDNGKIKKIQEKTQYNIIRDYLAERTYEESGNYTVVPFLPTLQNSLNDKLGNDGLYDSDQKTEQLNDPSDDLLCVKVSPGKAYVRGYDVENIATVVLDVNKPRDTKSNTTNVPFSMGNVLRVNNVSGHPTQSGIVNFHNRHNSEGIGIGSARTYTFNVTDSSYSNASTKWDLYLYDIQTYTKVFLNTSLSNTQLPASSFVKGKNSGANGYAVLGGGNSDLITLNQVSGKFAIGEQILINGVEVSNSIKDIVSYGTQDIKSISETSVGFKADAVLESFPLPNNVSEITISGTTATSAGGNFVGVKTDSVIRYQSATAGFKTETFNRVSEVSQDGLSLSLATISNDVLGVFDGAITEGTYQANFASPIIRNQEDAKLYEKLPDNDISSLDLSSSNLKIRLQSNQTQTSNSVGIVTLSISDFDTTGISTVAFSAFDAERYSLHNNTAQRYIGTITSDSFKIDTVNNTVSFSGLSGSRAYKLDATLTKTGIKSKKKTYTRSKELSVNLSRLEGSGSNENSSVNDGLTYNNNCYGLRVQDEEISLNHPDVSKIVAVYESLSSSDPTLDKITCLSTASIKTTSIIGENIISKSGNAVARFVKSTTDDIADIVYLNSGRFRQGDEITFEESNITTTITNISLGKYANITDNFTLDKGQRDQYYDYSRIVRKKDSTIPSKRLLIIFDYYEVDSLDTGDLFTIESYDNGRYAQDIPEIGVDGVRATDTLDFRPRVAPFSGTTKSPFDFNSRVFVGTNRIVAPNEDSFIGYDYYLGRIDKLYIDKLGVLSIKEGQSGINPKPPIISNQSMEIATISLPPYLFDPQDAEISLVDNRRYTMRDIGLIEDRVENLEEVTSLSLLEINTQTLQIKDAENRDRFKSGFFVDDFRTNSLINLDVSSVEVDEQRHEMRPFLSRKSLKGAIAISGNNRSPETIDYDNPSLELLDSDVKKKGRSITLDYDEVTWISQNVATKFVNVNEYHVVAYRGDVTLSPPNDIWTIVQSSTSVINRTNVFGRRGGGGVFRTAGSTTSVSRSGIRFARSRNTQFSATDLKPNTRYYQFLGSEGDLDVIPKLLEIEDVNGSFTIGEEIVGYQIDGDSNSVARIRFRLAKPNHKTGLFNSPDTIYEFNPYEYPQSTRLPDLYTESSTVLNVDTASLAQSAQGRYSGYVEKGFVLEGQSSGATASVKDLRLITDAFGDLIGTFFIRNPNDVGNVRIENSTHTYKLTNSSTNREALISEELDTLLSFARTQYITSGTLERRFTTITNTTTVIVGYGDPLAQSFTVGGNIDAPSAIGRNDDENGIFLTSVNLYFATVDEENKPLRVEIRSVELGTPTTQRIGESAHLTPKKFVDDGNGNISEQVAIKTSETGQEATRVTFPEPIYLAPGREYALVIISEYSDQYQVWTAEMGKKSVTTQDLPDADAGVYSRQYAFGSLFMSQNGSIWTEDQNQDLKFDIFKAKFTSDAGTAFFYNSPLDLSNGYKRLLDNNPIRTLPKTATIRITPVKKGATDFSAMQTALSPGRKLAGDDNYPGSVAYITGVGCSVFNDGNDVGIITGGINYGVNASTNVGTYNIVGSGKNLTLDIPATTNGTIQSTGLVVNNGGSGYKVGDVVGIVTSDTTDRTGRDAQISISEIGGIDTLFVSGMQGDIGSGKAFNVGMGVSYYDNNGVVVSMSSTVITGIDNGPTLNSGNYIRVNHFNHGMYSNTNKVMLNDLKSSDDPTTLSIELLSSDTNKITLGSTTGFDTFEGVVVSAANTGYLRIGREIIGYELVDTGNELKTITRGVDNTNIVDHKLSDSAGNSLTIPVYKYQLNGVSLRRINGAILNVTSEGMDINGYYAEIIRAGNGSGRSTDTSDYAQLSFTNELQIGGKDVNSSENIVFTEVIPSFPLLIPNDSTSVSGSIRTISGTSVDGSEPSFVDEGYEPIEINEINKLSSIRMVASEVNEDEYLSTMPSKKSLTTAIRLSTTDENLSPQIFYTEEAGTILQNPLINNPVSDYATDNRVNSLIYDPHSAIYVSNTVTLKNPATSLKVLVAAYRHETADFRVLYKLNRADSSEVEQEFELFPGYDNLEFENDALLTVKDQSKNSGRPDVFVKPSLEDEFLDYEFTANNLDLFTGYTIKIVMSGTNAAYYPIFKDLRTIAIR